MTPRCEAEKAAERIKDNKTITEKDILQIEMFLRVCISACSDLNKTLNKYLADKKRDQDEINFPTTTEQDKKAQGGKGWLRKWF